MHSTAGVVGGEKFPQDAVLPPPRQRESASAPDGSPLVPEDHELDTKSQTKAGSLTESRSIGLAIPREAIDDGLREDTASWHPFWLRQRILAAFCGLFLGLVVALITLVVYSRRNDGLGSASNSLRYVWVFGPTAGKTAGRFLSTEHGRVG